MIFAHQVHETGAAHGFHRLLVGVRNNQAHAVFVAVTVEVFKRVHARRIKRRHAAHADDQVFRELLDRDIGNLVGHAKEHRTVDLVYAYALGKLA